VRRHQLGLIPEELRGRERDMAPLDLLRRTLIKGVSRRRRRGPRARRSATLMLATALLAGGIAMTGGQSFAAPQTAAVSGTTADATSCPSVTGTVSSTPTANWLAQQASQSFATEQLAASPRKSLWVRLRFHGQTMKAWVDYPVGRKNAPVVLVLHEVFGGETDTRVITSLPATWE
jgi:carboxymethylenebutenolidase